jgi:hypothetical protein
MNFLKNIKNLLLFYKVVSSPSKIIIKYGSLVSIELVIVSIGLLLINYVSPSSFYMDSSFLMFKTSISVFIELIICAFIFDYIFDAK